MDRNIRKIFQVSAYILFGATFVLVFANFTRIRTIAAFHVYKEYLSGVLVLSVLYFNAFILFPLFFKTMRVKLYLLSATFCTIVICAIEMLLISSDAFQILQNQFSPPEARLFFFTDTLSVFFRDILFMGFSFSLLALQYYFTQNSSKEMAMAQDMNILEATFDDENKTKVRVNIRQVSYVIQDKNITYLWLTNGSRAQRYGSLSMLLKILDEKSYVQLTGSTLAICNNILRYDTVGVVVKGTPKKVMLPYSEKYREKAMSQIFEKTGLNPQENRGNRKKQIYQGSRNRLQQKSYNEKLIYSFIFEHPDCSAAEIKKNRSVSQSTVNRILKQLKQDGLIEYVGSKKTGGYRAVEKREM
jgi:hypothetical protein